MQIINNCSCVSEYWSVTDVELRRANYSMCSNQSSKDGQFSSSPVQSGDPFSKALCANRVERTEFDCDCELPCDELVYGVSVSASGAWPHETYQKAFYDMYVRGTSFGDKIHKHAKDTVSWLHLVAES